MFSKHFACKLFWNQPWPIAAKFSPYCFRPTLLLLAHWICWAKVSQHEHEEPFFIKGRTVFFHISKYMIILQKPKSRNTILESLLDSWIEFGVVECERKCAVGLGKHSYGSRNLLRCWEFVEFVCLFACLFFICLFNLEKTGANVDRMNILWWYVNLEGWRKNPRIIARSG